MGEALGRPRASPRHLPGTILNRFGINFLGYFPRTFWRRCIDFLGGVPAFLFLSVDLSVGVLVGCCWCECFWLVLCRLYLAFCGCGLWRLVGFCFLFLVVFFSGELGTGFRWFLNQLSIGFWWALSQPIPTHF